MSIYVHIEPMIAVSQRYPTGPKPNRNSTPTNNPIGNPAPDKGPKGFPAHFWIAGRTFLMRNGHIYIYFFYIYIYIYISNLPTARFRSGLIGTAGCEGQCVFFSPDTLRKVSRYILYH